MTIQTMNCFAMLASRSVAGFMEYVVDTAHYTSEDRDRVSPRQTPIDQPAEKYFGRGGETEIKVRHPPDKSE